MVENGAIVDPSAVIADSAKIERGAYIGKNCVIGENVTVAYNAVVQRDTTIGDGSIICSNAHIGGDPQDYSFGGEDTKLIIGKNCTIREFATIHRASTKEDVWETRLGDNCFIMAYAHIAHDCKIGNNLTMTSYASFGGHCHVGDFVNMGGYAGCHQFVRIGDGCMIGGASVVLKDVPPYCLTAGHPARVEGLNTVGLKRRGMKPDARLELKRALKIYKDLKNKMKDVPDMLLELQQFDEIVNFRNFLTDSKRSFTRR